MKLKDCKPKKSLNILFNAKFFMDKELDEGS